MNNITFIALAAVAVSAIAIHHAHDKPDNRVLHPERFREDARDRITIILPKEEGLGR